MKTITVESGNKRCQLTVPVGTDPTALAIEFMRTGKCSAPPPQPVVQRTDFEVLENLIATGADIPAVDKKDRNGGLVARAMRDWYLDAVGNPCKAPPTAAQRDKIAAKYISLVKRLVEAGADPAMIKYDFAPLSYIAALADMGSNPAAEIELTRYLLEHGGTLAFPNDRMGNALNSAAASGNRGLLDVMLQYGKPDRYMKNGALLGAVMGGKWAVANHLMEAGADPNVKPSDYPYGKSYYKTLFDEVLSNKPYPAEFIKAMLAHGANPNVQLYSYYTPLLAVMPDPELMRALLDAGADPNAREATWGGPGDTALQLAMSEDRIKDPEARARAVELLLRHGAKADLPSKAGVTPLMQASARDAKIISLLLDAGARQINTGMGQTPYQNQFPRGPVVWALTRGNETLATLWLQKYRKLDNDDCGAVYYAARGGEAATLNALLDLHAPVTVAEEHGETPLIGAARAGQVRTVKILLDRHAASINETATPPTILFPGLDPARNALASMLLSAGTQPGGVTALMAAAEYGRTDVVDLLIERGADLSQRDKLGQTALDYATRNNHPEIVAMLNAHGGGPREPRPQEVRDQQAFAAAVAPKAQKALSADTTPISLSRPETGKNPVLPGDESSMEMVECEKRAIFTFYGYANEQGQIGAFICDKNAKRVQQLAVHADRDYAAILGGLTHSGITRAQAHRAGWYYAHHHLNDDADYYFFPLLEIGHGILTTHTAILYDKGIKRAVIIQLTAYPMCERREYADAPVCKDMETILKNLAKDVAR